jgi:hypothetical protein
MEVDPSVNEEIVALEGVVVEGAAPSVLVKTTVMVVIWPPGRVLAVVTSIVDVTILDMSVDKVLEYEAGSVTTVVRPSGSVVVTRATLPRVGDDTGSWALDKVWLMVPINVLVKVVI